MKYVYNVSSILQSAFGGEISNLSFKEELLMKTNRQTVLTAGQMRELICAVQEGIPANIGADVAQYWIGRKKKLAAEIKNILVGTNSYADLISDWENFYRDLGTNCDLSGVAIPDDPGGFERVIIVATGITPQTAYDLCVKNFQCLKYAEKNLGEIMSSDRSAKNGPYAIRVRNRVEADEELKNLSANQLKTQSVAGITLEERLVYEIKYFKETGKHLDIKNITLCAGSRDGDGDVPIVDWSGGEMRVRWYYHDVRGDFLRSREAVS